jgi:nucleoside-diphosphate-sugar epimerase
VRLWVTGARGFIGRHLVAQAALAGHEVWAIDRDDRDGEPMPQGIRLLPLDVGDAARVETCVQESSPEAIVHLAWYASPQDYLTSPHNVESLAATLTLARTALLFGCPKMLAVGTCLEYAERSTRRIESDPLDPKSLYARCKRAAHLVLEEFFERAGASLTWARLFHMHGPGEHPARLIPSLAKALREGRPFALSAGEQLRDHLDVRDVASALLHLLGCAVKGPVNVCSGQPVTLRAVVEAVAHECGRPELLRLGERPYAENEIMNLTGDPGRLMQTGWRPAHTDLARSLHDELSM